MEKKTNDLLETPSGLDASFQLFSELVSEECKGDSEFARRLMQEKAGIVAAQAKQSKRTTGRNAGGTCGRAAMTEKG